jgi:hypothetical protein
LNNIGVILVLISWVFEETGDYLLELAKQSVLEATSVFCALKICINKTLL